MTTTKTVGSGFAALRRGAAAGLFVAFAFAAGAASGGDNAAFVSYSGVPSTMTPGSKANVTVRMRNTGTTTWRNTFSGETVTSYALMALGHGCGVGSVGVSGVAPTTAPTGKVTVSVRSASTGTAKVSPATLTFSKGDTAAKTVTVTGEPHCSAKDRSATMLVTAVRRGGRAPG